MSSERVRPLLRSKPPAKLILAHVHAAGHLEQGAAVVHTNVTENVAQSGHYHLFVRRSFALPASRSALCGLNPLPRVHLFVAFSS